MDVLAWAVLPETIGPWKVPDYLAGAIGKFRTEPSYTENLLNRYPDNQELVFRISSSWGLTQVMGRNLVVLGKSQEWQKKVIKDLTHFASNPVWQLHWAADFLDKLLVSAKGDLHKAYVGYNAGSITSIDLAAHVRAAEVVAREKTWKAVH